MPEFICDSIGKARHTGSFLLRVATLARQGFPFAPGRMRGGPMGRVHIAARRALFARHSPGKRRLLQLAATIAWPLGAVAEIARCLPATPPPFRPASRWGWLRRSSDALWIALSRNIPPLEYVRLRLHEADRRDWGNDVFCSTELSVLPMLNQRLGADPEDVQDKERFARICGEHALACVPTLAVFHNGAQRVPERAFLPTQPALWAKDLAGSRGSGGMRWDRVGACYRNAEARLCSPEALVAEWRGRDTIVQPLMRNHPALDALGDGSLVDIRIVTGRTADGEVVTLAALTELPCPRPTGERRHLIAAIDAESGTLLRAYDRKEGPISIHPLLGTPLCDHGLPHWRACVDLVHRAHRIAFARFVFLGWDVIVTPDGPLLLEANSGWNPVPPQIALDRPLGRTRFAAIAAQYLEGDRCA